MATKTIRFFSPKDNGETKEKSTTKSVSITGHVSSSGKLVFPAKSVAYLSFNPDTAYFKIGTQEGKRKVKSLYLIPVVADEAEAFKLVKAAKSYTIPLGVILQKGGVDYANAKYSFTIKPFDYEGGMSGYELQLSSDAPKVPYTGKPRGRRKRVEEPAQ